MDEDATVLTSYFRERQRAGPPLGRALLDLGRRHSVAASVLLRGVEGYGRDGLSPAGRAVPPADGPPLAVVAAGARARIDALLSEAAGLTGPRLVTLERARLLSGDIGPHGDRAPHGGQLGHHVPVVTTVIDEPERIAVALDVIDALTAGRGLVTAEAVLVPRPAGVSSGHGP